MGVGYLFSYFWTASTAIYYLLRRDIDATEMDEVYIEEERNRAPPSHPHRRLRRPGDGRPGPGSQSWRRGAINGLGIRD